MCRLCKGLRNLFCVQDGAYEWYACPACGGSGVRVLHAPPTIRVHTSKHRPSQAELDLVAFERGEAAS